MANNLIQQIIEAVVSFLPDGSTAAETVIFELDGLASGAGRQSATHDLTTSPHTNVYAWRAFVQFATAPVVGERVDFYLKTNSGTATTTHPDNDDGVGDLAVSAEDKLANLHYLGSIVVDEAAANVEMVASGVAVIRARACQIVAWNASADALTTDEDENGFLLTPSPDEIE